MLYVSLSLQVAISGFDWHIGRHVALCQIVSAIVQISGGCGGDRSAIERGRERVAHGLAEQFDMADQQVAAPVEQVDCKEVRGARHMGAAVAGHGSSSLSVVLAGGPYRWIAKRYPPYAISTTYTADASTLRRVESGEAFSTRYFRATHYASLPGYSLSPRVHVWCSEE